MDRPSKRETLKKWIARLALAGLAAAILLYLVNWIVAGV